MLVKKTVSWIDKLYFISNKNYNVLYKKKMRLSGSDGGVQSIIATCYQGTYGGIVLLVFGMYLPNTVWCSIVK